MKKIFLLAITMLMATQLYAQNIVAKGNVKDDKGNTIIGATITEKGVTNSTLTDANGNFQLSLMAGKEIVIDMKGYEKQVVKVGPNGEIPAIILNKGIKRVRFGVKGGVDYNYYKYRYVIEGINSWNDEEFIYEHEAIGYNAGVYMDLNFSRTFSFELGLQVYMRDKDLTTLNVPIAVCKWRMGSRKHFFICWGPGAEFLIRKPAFTQGEYYRQIGPGAEFLIQNPADEISFSSIAVSLNLSVGYEFESGFGLRLNGKMSVDLSVEEDEHWTGGCACGGVALSYRF